MKKQHSVITFVIHSLQLPKEYNDLFSIEFKRGSNEGMTERSVAVPPQTEGNIDTVIFSIIKISLFCSFSALLSPAQSSLPD